MPWIIFQSYKPCCRKARVLHSVPKTLGSLSCYVGVSRMSKRIFLMFAGSC